MKRINGIIAFTLVLATLLLFPVSGYAADRYTYNYNDPFYSGNSYFKNGYLDITEYTEEYVTYIYDVTRECIHSGKFKSKMASNDDITFWYDGYGYIRRAVLAANTEGNIYTETYYYDEGGNFVFAYYESAEYGQHHAFFLGNTMVKWRCVSASGEAKTYEAETYNTDYVQMQNYILAEEAKVHAAAYNKLHAIPVGTGKSSEVPSYPTYVPTEPEPETVQFSTLDNTMYFCWNCGARVNGLTCSNCGQKLKVQQKADISMFEGYAIDISQCPESLIGELKMEVEDIVHRNVETTWDTAESLDSMMYIGTFLLAPKKENTTPHNYIGVVYQNNVKIRTSEGYRDSLSYYYVVTFNNLYLNHGEWSLDLHNYSIPDSKVERRPGNHYYYYLGYHSLNEVARHCVSDFRGEYKCTATPELTAYLGEGRYCPDCGKKLPKYYKFCTVCGTEFNQNTVSGDIFEYYDGVNETGVQSHVYGPQVSVDLFGGSTTRTYAVTVKNTSDEVIAVRTNGSVEDSQGEIYDPVTLKIGYTVLNPGEETAYSFRFRNLDSGEFHYTVSANSTKEASTVAGLAISENIQSDDEYFAKLTNNGIQSLSDIDLVLLCFDWNGQFLGTGSDTCKELKSGESDRISFLLPNVVDSKYPTHYDEFAEFRIYVQ